MPVELQLVNSDVNSQGLDLNQILADANRQLPFDLQVRPDDPMVSLVALNNALFKTYTAALQKSLDESQHAIGAATRQEVETATEIASKMLDRTGDHMKKLLVEAVNESASHWQAQYQAMMTEELQKVQEASRFAKIGGYLALLGGTILVTYAAIQLLLRFGH